MWVYDEFFSESLTKPVEQAVKTTVKAQSSSDAWAFNGDSNNDIFSDDYEFFKKPVAEEKWFTDVLFNSSDKSRSYWDSMSDVWDMFKWAWSFFKWLYEWWEELIETNLLNKHEKQWIYDLDKFQQYSEKLMQYKTEWNEAEYNRYYNKMVDEWVVDFDQYNKYQDQIQEMSEEEWTKYKQQVNEEYISSVSKDLEEIEDPYIQKMIYAWSEEMVKEFWGFYDTIEATFETTHFSKEEWKKKLTDVNNKQKEFFQEYVKQLKKFWDDEQAYDAVINQTYFQEIAEEVSRFWQDLRDASVKSSNIHYKDVIEDGNLLDKAGGSFMVFGNNVQNIFNWIGSILEDWKQWALGMYDVSEELGNLNVYRETDWFFKKSLGKASWMATEVIDWVPQFVPEVTGMILWSKWLNKVWKITKMNKYLDSISNPVGKKLAVFWQEFTKDIFMYDIIWRGMMDRWLTSEDVATDLLISWGINSIIWMLAAPAKQFSKFNNEKQLEYLIGEPFVDDTIIKAFKEWRTNEAIALSIKWTQNWLPSYLQTYTKADQDAFLNVVKTMKQNIDNWLHTNLDKLIISEWRNAAIQNKTIKEITESFTWRKALMEEVTKWLAKGDQTLIDKQNIVYLKQWLNDFKYDLDWLLSDIKTVDKTHYKMLWLADEEIEAVQAYTSVILWGNADLARYTEIIETSGKKVFNGISKTLDVMTNKHIVASDIIPEWAIHWKFKKTKDGFINLITWKKVSTEVFSNKYLTDSWQSLNSIRTNLSDLFWQFNKKQLYVDIAPAVWLSKFVSGKWLKNTKAATVALKSVLADLGFKFQWGKININETQLRKLVDAFDDIIAPTGKLETLNPVEMWALRLSFLDETFRNFERRYFMQWAKIPNSQITNKAFRETSMFTLWDEVWTWAEKKYVLNLKNWNVDKATAYMKKILKSNVSKTEQAKVIKEMWTTDKVITDLKSGKSTKTILKEEVEKSKILNEEVNKPLKTKYNKDLEWFLNKVVDSTENLRANSVLMALLKDSIFFTPAVIYSVATSDSESQDDFIKDLLFRIALGSSVGRHLIKSTWIKKAFPDAISKIKETYKSITKESVKTDDVLKKIDMKDSEVRKLVTVDQKWVQVNKDLKFEELSKRYFWDMNIVDKEATNFSTKELWGKYNQFVADLYQSIKLADDIKWDPVRRNNFLRKISNKYKREYSKLLKRTTSEYLETNKLSIVKTKLLLDDLVNSHEVDQLFKKIEDTKALNIPKFIDSEYTKILKKTFAGKKPFADNYIVTQLRKDYYTKALQWKRFLTIPWLQDKVAQNSDMIFASNKRLEHIATDKLDIREEFVSTLNNKDIKKVFIIDDNMKHFDSRNWSKLDIDKTKYITMSDILSGEAKIEKWTQYLIGKKVFYSYFGEDAGKILFRNHAKNVPENFKPEVIADFLDNLDNVKWIDLNLSMTDEWIYTTQKNLYGISNILDESKILDKTKIVDETDHSGILNQNQNNQIYLGNFRFQNILEEITNVTWKDFADARIKEILDTNKDYQKISKLMDNINIKDWDTIWFEDAMNSMFLHSDLASKYIYALKKTLWGELYHSISKTNVNINDVLVDSRILNKVKADVIIDISTDNNLKTQLMKLENNQADFLEKIKDLPIEERVYQLYKQLDWAVNSEQLKAYVYKIIADNDLNPYAVVNKLPIYIKNWLVPPMDVIYMNNTISGLLKWTGKTVDDFNVELEKITDDIIWNHFFTSNNEYEIWKEIAAQIKKLYKDIDDIRSGKISVRNIDWAVQSKYKYINIYQKYSDYVNRGWLSKSVIYELFKILKQRGLLSKDIDIIKAVEWLSSEMKWRLISNMKWINNLGFKDNDKFRQTVIDNIFNVITTVDSKAKLAYEADWLSQADLIDDVIQSWLTTSNYKGKLEDTLLWSVEMIEKNLAPIRKNIVNWLKLTDISVIWNKAKDLWIFKMMPYNYKLASLMRFRKWVDIFNWIDTYYKDELIWNKVKKIPWFFKALDENKWQFDSYFAFDILGKTDFDPAYFRKIFANKKYKINLWKKFVDWKFEDVSINMWDLLDSKNTPTKDFYTLMRHIVDRVKKIEQPRIEWQAKNSNFDIFEFEVNWIKRKYNESILHTHPIFKLLEWVYWTKPVKRVNAYFDDIYNKMQIDEMFSTMIKKDSLDWHKLKLRDSINKYRETYIPLERVRGNWDETRAFKDTVKWLKDDWNFTEQQAKYLDEVVEEWILIQHTPVIETMKVADEWGKFDSSLNVTVLKQLEDSKSFGRNLWEWNIAEWLASWEWEITKQLFFGSDFTDIKPWMELIFNHKGKYVKISSDWQSLFVGDAIKVNPWKTVVKSVDEDINKIKEALDNTCSF